MKRIRTLNANGLMAQFTDFFLNKHKLSDEVEMLQLGQVDTTEFFTITNSVSQESNSNTWPTKEE